MFAASRSLFIIILLGNNFIHSATIWQKVREHKNTIIAVAITAVVAGTAGHYWPRATPISVAPVTPTPTAAGERTAPLPRIIALNAAYVLPAGSFPLYLQPTGQLRTPSLQTPSDLLAYPLAIPLGKICAGNTTTSTAGLTACYNPLNSQTSTKQRVFMLALADITDGYVTQNAP